MAPSRSSLALSLLILVGLWLLLQVVAQHTRPLLPLDETRYVSVAWEMWLREDFLVPFKNGEAYSHKPPLLFWLIQAGWWAFGVNEWWPRLVAPLFALGSLLLVSHLAMQLWPQRDGPSRLAPPLLMSSALWVYFNTATMFDMLVVFFTLAALSALLRARRSEGRWAGWLGYGTAIGLGILAKGPVILLHTLPVALLAPLWMRDPPRPRWGAWYTGVAAALILAAAISLAWAIPAAKAGGSEYASAILWGQTAGRVVESFAHERPFWWYLAVLPLLLFPLSLWPSFWRSLASARERFAETGTRFCSFWLIVTLGALSLISSKQPHYLLPIFPSLALLAARGMDGQPATPVRVPAAAPGLLAAGALIILAPLVAARIHLPSGLWWLPQASTWSGWALLAAGAVLITLGHRHWSIISQTLAMAAGVTAMTIAVHYSLLRAALPAYDLSEIGRYLHALQQRGVPLTHFGKYHAQFQFPGRLERPLDVIEDRNVRPQAWLKTHPSAAAIHYVEAWSPALAEKYAFAQPYRGGAVVVSLGEQVRP